MMPLIENENRGMSFLSKNVKGERRPPIDILNEWKHSLCHVEHDLLPSTYLLRPRVQLLHRQLQPISRSTKHRPPRPEPKKTLLQNMNKKIIDCSVHSHSVLDLVATCHCR
ncbi:unnamed protein product [Amoebophrya sp. A25]|nr:unnamed protein product [Amoebophrya sp. A25]|eukprot:GSA25T00004795001.1